MILWFTECLALWMLDDVAHVTKEQISDVSCTVAITDVYLPTPAASAAGGANHQVDDGRSNLFAMTDVVYTAY